MAYKYKLTLMLKSMCDGLTAKGLIPNTVVCGPGYAAVDITVALEELSLDLHIISDDEFSRYGVVVCDITNPFLKDYFGGTVN